MSNAPFMQLYVADYLADTLHLSTVEHGAYLLILMTMWRHDARLPNDMAKLARIARLSPAKFKPVWAEISRFFDVDGDWITNSRLSKEHEKSRKKSEVRATAGRAGGHAKALKDKVVAGGNCHADAMPFSSDIRDIEKEEPIGSSKKPSRSPPKRACSIPPDWVPSERNISDAIARNFTDQEISHEAERFRDYHLSRGTTFKDWDAGWRTWLSNARKFGASGPVARSPHYGGSKPVGGLVGAVLRASAAGH